MFLLFIFHVANAHNVLEELIIKMLWRRYISNLTSFAWFCLYAIKSDVVTILRFSSFCMTKQMPSSVILF